MKKVSLDQLSEGFCLGNSAQFSEALTKLIRTYGVSAVTRNAKINSSTLYRYMNGETDLPISSLLRILHSIGVRTSFEIEMPAHIERRFMNQDKKTPVI